VLAGEQGHCRTSTVFMWKIKQTVLEGPFFSLMKEAVYSTFIATLVA
jgi:hypothetical protein